MYNKYDKINKIIKQEGYDYYLITDQIIENKTELNWTILQISEKLNFSNQREIIKRQRYYKIHPHLFFQNYDLSIYFDTKYTVQGNLDEFLLRILTDNISIYVLEHPEVNTIHNEFERVLITKKDTIEKIMSIEKRYNRSHFPDNNGLSENCLIVRKHNQIKCVNFMNKWFNEIKQFSHRDQLSFNYILWKNDNKDVKYIPKNFALQYLKQKSNHLHNYVFKN